MTIVIEASAPASAGQIEGRWSDACPCSIPCSCWKGASPTVLRCTNIHVYSFHSGTFADEDLRGSIAVEVGLSELPGRGPTPQLLYVDEHESPARVRALETLIRGLYGRPLLARKVRVTRNITAKRHLVAIPEILSYEVAAPQPKQLIDRSVLDNLYPWLRDAQQWSARRVTFRLPDGSLQEYGGSNALSAAFSIQVDPPGSWPSAFLRQARNLSVSVRLDRCDSVPLTERVSPLEPCHARSSGAAD